MQYLAIGCRVAVAVVFLLAVTGKVVGRGAFAEFTRSVRDMKAAPTRLVGLTARATVLFEALTVVLVAIPRQIAAVVGFALALVLTAAFSGAILRTIRSGNRTSCRCFGRSSSPLGRRHLVRNGVLLAVAAAGLVAALAGGSAGLAGGLVAVLTGVFIGLLVAMFDDLAQLLAPTTPAGRAVH
jgi:methylamine utilization protein MauE